MKKTGIIIFYSWSGNTGCIARLIQMQTGAQLFEIDPVNAYPAYYSECVKQAKKEIRGNFMPELVEMPDNLSDHDIVFIGSPIWWHTMAPPIFTFLSQVDLPGKIVIPFCTHGGGGKGHFPDDVAALCQNSTVLEDLELFGNSGRSAEKDISDWLTRIGIIESV